MKEKLWEEMPEGRKKDQLVKQAALPFYLRFKVGKGDGRTSGVSSPKDLTG